MKILIVGSKQIWALENIYITYLRKLGCEIKIFPAPDLLRKRYYKSIFTKIIYRILPSLFLNKINRQLLLEIKAFKPKVVWIFKGKEIFIETLIKIKNQDIFLCNYNPDHPFIISSAGGGNKNVTKTVKYYDLHFCYSQALMEKIKSTYNIDTIRLPFGFDLREDLYQMIKREQEILEVCFVGNPDKIRATFIKKLANKFKINVFGLDWNKWIKHPNVKVHNSIFGDEFWKVLRRYRVQLNIFRPHNKGSHNMRTFEIPAIGGVMLAPYSTEHCSFFDTSKEIFVYNNFEDAIKQIEFLLALPFEEANSIRCAAREKSINSKYSYEHKAVTVLKSITSRLNSQNAIT